MKISQTLLIMALVGTALGCTTTQISLHTNPAGADIYARAVGTGEYVHLGKSPIFMSNSQIVKGGSGPVQVEVRKEGYKTDEFIITEISMVNLHLNRELQGKRDFEMQAWLDRHITRMFEVRQLVQSNRYKDALNIIRTLKEEAPMVATVHQLEGGVQLLLRDYAAALAAYRNAFRLNPEDAQAIKMIRHLERTYGFRREVDLLDTDMSVPRQPAAESSP